MKCKDSINSCNEPGRKVHRDGRVVVTFGSKAGFAGSMLNLITFYNACALRLQIVLGGKVNGLNSFGGLK